MSELVLDLQDIQFTYPSKKLPTLQIPKFQIRQAEKIFLFGPSGKGKSTLLEIIAGVLLPQKGSLKILQKDVLKLSPSERDAFRADHMGYIFQTFNLLPYLTVKENIQLSWSFSKRRQSKVEDVDDEISRLCEKLGLSAFQYSRVDQLSIGQQQRAAAARAFLGHPELILADEPTSSLDYDHREKFIQLMFEVCEKEGSSLLFVSHDRSLEKLFDRSVSLAEINQAVL